MKTKHLYIKMTLQHLFALPVMALLSISNFCYPYNFPDSFPSPYPYSIVSYFFHKSYPEQECTPKGIQAQTLRLDYSERTETKNEFRVGWNDYSESEIPSYLKPSVGGEVRIARCLPPGKWVFLGKGNVEGINGNIVEAVINGFEYQGAAPGKFPQDFVETGNMYWRPMAGDSVFPIQKNINKKTSISPRFEISSQEIFVTQELNQFSYEISKQGEELLKEKFSYFKNMNGRMLVEGFILTSGNREELRIESLMRAQAISKYLVNIFKLDQNQVIAIGYGNDWLQPGMQPVKSWPQKDITNGIILKMLPD
jgi:OmpA family